MGVLSKHLFDIPPALLKTNPQAIVPEALELLVMSALAKDADKRPASMVELKKRLAAAADLTQENTLLSESPALRPTVPERGSGPSAGQIPSTMMQTASSDFEPEFGKTGGGRGKMVHDIVEVQGEGVFHSRIIDDRGTTYRKGDTRTLFLQVSDNQPIKDDFSTVIAEVYHTRGMSLYCITVIDGEPPGKFLIEKRHKIIGD